MTRRKEEWNGADVVGLGHVVPYGLSYPSLPLPLRSTRLIPPRRGPASPDETGVTEVKWKGT